MSQFFIDNEYGSLAVPLTLLEDEFHQLKQAASSASPNGECLLDSFYQLDSNCQPVSYVFNSDTNQFAFDELESLLQSVSSSTSSAPATSSSSTQGTTGDSMESASVDSLMQQQQQQPQSELRSNSNVNLLKSHVHVILKEVLKLKKRPGVHILSFVKVRQGK